MEGKKRKKGGPACLDLTGLANNKKRRRRAWSGNRRKIGGSRLSQGGKGEKKGVIPARRNVVPRGGIDAGQPSRRKGENSSSSEERKSPKVCGVGSPLQALSQQHERGSSTTRMRRRRRNS